MALYFLKFALAYLGLPRLLLAAKRGHRGLQLLPWLQAWARRQGEDGRLAIDGEPADAGIIALSIPDATPEQVEVAMASLLAVGILERDGEVLRFTLWREIDPDYASASRPAVRERVRRHREKRRKEGKAPGNEVTSDVTSDVTSADIDTDRDTDVDTDGDPDSDHTPRSRGSRVKRGSGNEPDPALLADFEIAWTTYPKRPGNSKAKALKAYQAQRAAGHAAADMLAGVNGYAAHVRREATAPQFIKHTATFFGPDKCWQDDYTPVARTGRNGESPAQSMKRWADEVVPLARIVVPLLPRALPTSPEREAEYDRLDKLAEGESAP